MKLIAGHHMVGHYWGDLSSPPGGQIQGCLTCAGLLLDFFYTFPTYSHYPLFFHTSPYFFPIYSLLFPTFYFFLTFPHLSHTFSYFYSLFPTVPCLALLSSTFCLFFPTFTLLYPIFLYFYSLFPTISYLSCFIPLFPFPHLSYG